MDRQDVELLATIGTVLLAIFLASIGMAIGIFELSFPGELAQIEQLREDVGRVDRMSNEDVIGQVTSWNQKIKALRRYRQIWWGRIFIPEEWESVEVIEIP